jgi:hypothetical protein
MAFIVEMWWGRPHEIVVQDVDDNGELYDSHVIRNGPPDPERRTFACSQWNWEAAQQIAREFGWQPKGPLFRPWRPKDAAPTRMDAYEPDGWLKGLHEVEDDDARAWSVALARAVNVLESGQFHLPEVTQPALIRDGMDLNDFRRANRGLTPQFLRAFCAFLGKGRFKFGWDS